jgi:hypothetical protein
MTDDELRTAAARLVAARVEQGLPARVEDPAALAKIAAQLRAQDATMTYPTRIPDPDDVSPGSVLVHHSVRPARRQGDRGSRYWLQPPAAQLERCDCGWASEHSEHFRVAQI